MSLPPQYHACAAKLFRFAGVVNFNSTGVLDP